MTASAWPLQDAVYEALIADGTLMAAVSGVFDNVEQDYDDFPYVTIGANIQTPNDTDTTVGDFNSFTVHVWSRPEDPLGGKKEASIVNGYIYGILNRNLLSVTGYTTVDLIAEGTASVELDPDGRTYHGVNTFNATLVEL